MLDRKRMMERQLQNIKRRRLSKWKWRVWMRNGTTEIWDFKRNTRVSEEE